MIAFAIYTNDGCVPCHEAKEKLEKYNVSYEEYQIGKDISREDVIKKFPDAKVTPVIYHYQSNSVIPYQILELVLIAEKMKEKEK